MAPKKDYTPNQMGLAMEAVRKGYSYSAAAQKYGVPRMTLRNKVTGKSPAVCHMGPPTILSTNEEVILKEWLFAMAERHCPLGKEQLLDSVQLIIKSANKKNPFTNDRPGRKWFDLFLRRHPEISERVSQNLTTSRESVKEEHIVKWFTDVEKYLEENNLSEVLKDPTRIFNTDESAFFLNPKPDRVLVKRGDKNIYSTSGNEKENLTVLLTANAAGQLAPPMVVFSYERIPRPIAESIPESWGIGRSENGWMCGSTFYEYVTNIFYPWLVQNKTKFPIIFFLDGHASHLTKHLSDFCSDKQIEVIALYPNSTHLLQPMDVSVFRPLKLFWRQETNKWKTENLGEQVKKENFAPILKRALESITPSCIKNGFRVGGLFPYGPDLVDFTKLNVHNRTSTNKGACDPTKNQAFLSHLEAEMVKIFTQSKLDTFNKCFYLSKSELADALPTEDLTMYTIWAKYKHLCGITGYESVTEAVHGQKDDKLGVEQNKNRTITAGVKTTYSEIVKCHDDSAPTSASSFAQALQNEYDLGPDNNNQKGSDNHQSESKQNQDLLSEFDISALASVQKTPSKVTPSASESSSAQALQNEDVLGPKHNNKKGSDNEKGETKQNQDLLSKCATIPFVQKTPIKITPSTSSALAKSKDEIIPSNSSTASFADHMLNKGILVPSPFKKALFWPEPIQKKRKISKETIPSAITSKAWREFHAKKDSEKKEKEKIKEKRKQQLEEKRKLKEKAKIDKQKNTSRRKQNFKKRRHVSITSSESDSNVTYVESGESEMDITNESDEDLTLSDLKLKNSMKENDNINQRQLALSLEKVDAKTSDENLVSTPKVIVEQLPYNLPVTSNDNLDEKMSCGIPNNTAGSFNVSADDYVIVIWNERKFPGQVVSVSEEGALVSCLKKCKEFWRWPMIKDLQLYSWDNIVCQIAIPTFAKKGCFVIPEMDNL